MLFKKRRTTVKAMMTHSPQPKSYAAAFLICCSFSLFLVQFVYLSGLQTGQKFVVENLTGLQNSQKFVIENLILPNKTDRVDHSDLPQRRPVFQSEKSGPSEPAPIAPPLHQPIKLDGQLNYPPVKAFYDENADQFFIASHAHTLGQSGKGYERFSIDVLPFNSKKSKEHVFHSLILKASHRHALDPALIKAIIMAESSFNPKAISKKGAKGLMQLMPNTAKALGVKDLFDPEQNIEGGARYFKKLLNTFNGDIRLALAAYNAGSRKVRQYKGVPPFSVTKYYIKKVIEYHKNYREQMTSHMSSFHNKSVM